MNGVAYGEIYKWVDRHGVMHYSAVPPQDGDATSKIESMPTTPRKDLEPQVTPEGKEFQATKRPMEKAPPQETSAPVVADAQVEMFMTTWCGYCKKAREFFAARGIAITEYDVEVDPVAAQRKLTINPSPGVPLVVINGRPIQGFAPQLYERALQGQ